MTSRDTTRLQGVSPILIGKVDQILRAMEALGMLMGVTDGVRTAEQQFALYQQGRTQQNNAWVKTGDTVTNCDGILKRSNHQPHESDGLGHAVDVAFIVDMNEDGQVALNEPFTWDQHRNWALYGAMAKAIGCVWGGDWVSIVDLPHIELP